MIRLVQVLPGIADDPVCCTVTHHHLNQLPKYWALSYSWNSDSNCESVMCGGDRLVVQQSVYQLMWRLRQQSEPITLWVDAICIDQSNRSERNSQVEMMDRIYTSAETVVIWVGEENERTPMLAEYLKRVESALNNGEPCSS